MKKNTSPTVRAISIAALCSLVIGLSSAVSGGESGTLAGRTVDFDGKAVKKVSIVLTSPDDQGFVAETTSDKNGDFEISVDNAENAHEITFERRGFVIMKTAVDIDPGRTTERVFTMLTQKEVDEGKGEIVRQREIAANAQPAIDLYNEGVGALQAGDLDAARNFFEQAIELDDSMAPALAALSVVATEQQDWPAAAQAAAQTLVIDPTDIRALYAAYRANSALGNDELATQAAESLTSSGENVDAAARIFNEGANAYLAQNVADAKALFEQAVRLDPTLTDALGALAAIYLSEGEFDKAGATAEEALAIEPENDRALKVRFEASLVGGAGNLDNAASTLATVDPTYLSKRLNERAFDLFEKNRYQEARILAELLLAIDPNDARANYTLGLILVNGGETEAGREHLALFLSLTPDDPDAEGVRLMIEAL